MCAMMMNLRILDKHLPGNVTDLFDVLFTLTLLLQTKQLDNHGTFSNELLPS